MGDRAVSTCAWCKDLEARRLQAEVDRLRRELEELRERLIPPPDPEPHEHP